MLNAARSSAAVCSSSVVIRSAVSPCGKKAIEPDGVLRFVVPGPKLRVPDAAAANGRRRDRPRQWPAPQRGQGPCRSGHDTLAAWAPLDAEVVTGQRRSSPPATAADVEQTMRRV
jgi:hypothetical protein